MKVFLDAGHGGKDPGACASGLVEKSMTLITAKGAKAQLEAAGVTVMLSRTDDRFLTLTERAEKANRWGADLLVSCHYNAGGGDRGEVIHSVSGGRGKALAEKVAMSIAELGQGSTRIYCKPATSGSGDYFTVIAKSNMPAIIVEPCFIDSSDRELADTEDKQWGMGIAVAKGILNYLGIKEARAVKELTEVNDIVYELAVRDIISDSDLWIKRLNESKNDYWLARKAVSYIRRAGV